MTRIASGKSAEARRRHGALRDEVLATLLHAESSMTARQVAGALAERSGAEPALTTVLTVLDRLYKAGEVEKQRSGRGELRFNVARHEAASAADDMLDALLRSKDRTGALLSFTGALDDADLALLRSVVESRAKANP